MLIGEWFNYDPHDEFRATIGQLDGTVINSKEVLDMFDEHVSGERNNERLLWSVFVYNKWVECI
jgi:hypothetical protein